MRRSGKETSKPRDLIRVRLEIKVTSAGAACRACLHLRSANRDAYIGSYLANVELRE